MGATKGTYAMSNKTRQPRRLFRARRQPPPPVDHGQRFKAALGAVEVEDFIVGPEACSLCGELTSGRAVRMQRLADGKVEMVLLYLCGGCQRDDGVAKLDKLLDSAT